MSRRLIWLPKALQDLARLRDIIRVHNPSAAQRAATRIREAVRRLPDHPMIGRPVPEIERPQVRDFCSFLSVRPVTGCAMRSWRMKSSSSGFGTGAKTGNPFRHPDRFWPMGSPARAPGLNRGRRTWPSLILQRRMALGSRSCRRARSSLLSCSRRAWCFSMAAVTTAFT